MNIAQIRKELATEAKTYNPKRRYWTMEEEAILAEFFGKVPVDVLAKKLNRSVASVQNHRIK